MKRKRIIMLTLAVALLIAGITLIAKSMIDIVPNMIEQQTTESLAKEIHDIPRKKHETHEDAIERKESIKWDVIEEKVPNTKSWLKIEGTHIDNPVAQATEDDPDYWLSHNINGYYSRSGIYSSE